MKRAVFLDRDGTIVEDLDFLTDLAQLRLLPHAAKAIRSWNEAGYLVVVITNQSGVARGFLSEKTLQAMHSELSSMLAAQGAHIDAYYYCPHHPQIGSPDYRMDCACRKPKPGMFLQAAQEHSISLEQSFAIGDSLRDAQAAQQAGVKPILVKTGPHSEEAASENPKLFCHIANNLQEAAEFISPQKQSP